MQSILIYGGSFDPPHLGHLNTALNVQRYFHFDKIIFLPCKIPVLKNPTKASAQDRIKMLQLMLKNYPEFSISTVEIDRETPSYMTETLKSLREQLESTNNPSVSMSLLLGMDALINLPQWHQFEKIPTLCNLLIIKRHGISKKNYPEILQKMFNSPCQHARDLLESRNGKLVFFDAGQYPISSTALREKIQHKETINNELPDAVHDYINQHGLYL